MKSLLFSLLAVVIFATQISAQTDQISGNHKVKGIVRDTTGAVFSNINLSVQKGSDNRTFVTDANGEFVMGLQPGDYEITVNKTNSADFKAYIKIQEGNLNPDNLVFVLDPNVSCCVTSSGTPYPRPTALPKPPYPAAARAVRASGEVVVAVKIGKDGKVIAATAESGHPLLRKAGEAAARGARFEAVEMEAEREAKLTYVFMSDESEKPGLNRYTNLYRISVTSSFSIIDQASH